MRGRGGTFRKKGADVGLSHHGKGGLIKKGGERAEVVLRHSGVHPEKGMKKSKERWDNQGKREESSNYGSRGQKSYF